MHAPLWEIRGQTGRSRVATLPSFCGWPTLFLLRVPHPFAICAKGWAAQTLTPAVKCSVMGPRFPPLRRTRGSGTHSRGESNRIKFGHLPAHCGLLESA